MIPATQYWVFPKCAKLYFKVKFHLTSTIEENNHLLFFSLFLKLHSLLLYFQ